MTGLYQGLGVAMLDWSKHHEGYLPPLDSEPGRLMCQGSALYPRYVGDKWYWTYPGDGPTGARVNGPKSQMRAAADDHSYFYMGYVILDDVQGAAFARAYAERLESGGAFDTDLEVPPGRGNFGSCIIHRLRTDLTALAPQGWDATQIEVLRSQVPVIVQRPKKTCCGEGGIVLYLDNHVEYLSFPSEFPMSSAFIQSLRQIDVLGLENRE